VKIEFVGGPKCGDTRDVDRLPSSIETSYTVPPRSWIVTYQRTGAKTNGGNYRYAFAGQREFTTIPA
jgi:hypothetical protein